MDNKVKLEYFPWLIGRENSDIKPVFKIVARSMSLAGDSIVMLHQSGCRFVVNYYVSDVVSNEKIMSQLNTEEANLLRWVVKSEITNPLEG